MAQTYQVGDTQYQFPDNYTDDQVTGILSKQGIIGVPAVAAQTPPDASAEGAQAPADQGLYVNPNTPKPRGMVQPGNIDLRKLPVIDNGDGSYSTVYSTSFTDEKPESRTFGKDVLVRGILNGKRLDDLESDDQAKRAAAVDALKREYYKTGKHLGVFQPGTDEEYKSQKDPATAYGIPLHNDFAAGKIPGFPVTTQKPPQAPQKPSDTLPDPAAAVQIATALGRHIAEIATRPPSEMPPSIAPSSSPWSPPVKPAPTPGRQFASSSYQIEGPEPPPRGPVFVHRAGPLPAAYTTEPTTRQILQTPIIKPEDIDEAFPFLVGPFRLHAGMLKAAAGMTSPENAAIAAGSAGLGMIPGMTAKIASTGLSVYFATQAGKALLDKYPQLKSAVKAKDWQSALELGGGAVADAAMFYGAGKHALLTARGIPADLAARARAKAAKASAPEPTANTTGTEPYRPRPEPKPTEETTHENRKEPAPREPAAEPEGGKPAQSEPAVSARRGGEHERSTSVEPRARAEAAAAPKEVKPEDGLPPVAPGFVRLYRGQSAEFSPTTDYSAMTPQERARLPLSETAEDRPGLQFTTDPDLARVHSGGKPLLYVDVPEDVANAESARQAEKWHNQTGKLLPAEYANRARRVPAAAPKEVTSGGPDIKLNEFNANRGGYASAARLVLTSPKKLTSEDIQNNFFKDHDISVTKVRPSVFTSQGHPDTQLFDVQFHAPDGAAISAPQGIEESLGLKPGERYVDRPVTSIPRQKPAGAPAEAEAITAPAPKEVTGGGPPASENILFGSGNPITGEGEPGSPPAGSSTSSVPTPGQDMEAGGKIGELPPKASEFASMRDAEEQRVRETVLAKLTADPERYLAEYGRRFGNVFNADDAATLFEEYNDDRAKYRVAVHPAATWIRDELFRRSVEQPAEEGKNRVAFSAGGNAVGKTTAIEFSGERTAAQAVLDSTLASPEHAERLINEALARNKRVSVLYVARPLDDALAAMLERSGREGRLVSIDQLIASQQRSAETVRGLYAKFKDDPRFQFRFVDNSGDIPHLGTVDLAAPRDYTGGRESLNEILDAEYRAGRISEQTWRRVRGSGDEGKPPGGGQGGEGGSGGPGSPVAGESPQSPAAGSVGDTPLDQTNTDAPLEPEERERDTGPTYMGSGFGALEPLFREAKEEGDRLRNARNEALAAAKAAEADPEETKAGEKIRAYLTSERDLWAARTNQVIDRITRIVLPKIQDREALGIAREFRHHPLELQAFIDGTHPFLEEVDGGPRVADKNLAKLMPVLRQAQRILAKPTARERAADAAFTMIAERDLKEGRAGGWLESRWKSDEYLPHALNPAGEGKVAKIPSTQGRAMGKVGKYFGFGERRSERYPTMVHAVADGIIPKTLDPSALFIVHADQFARARATHLLEAHLADSGLGVWGDSKSAPEGWEQLAPHTEEFKRRAAYAVPGSFDPESRESELKVGTVGLYVPPFIAKALGPITDPDYSAKIPGFAKLRTMQRGLKEAILGLSGFHLLTENFMAAADVGPRGMLKAFSGTRNSPEFLANERDLIQHGGTTSIQGSTMDAYRGLRPGTIPTRAEVIRGYIPGSKQALAVADAVTRLTFDNVQRRFKAWSFALHRDAWIRDNPNATPEQLAEAKKGIASYVNGVYGGLHWENMGIGRMSVEVARALFLAPDWSGSNIALAKYAFDSRLSPGEVPFRRKLAGATTKESAQARLSRAFWTKQLLGGLIATQMLSLLFSQKLSRRPLQVYMGKDRDGNDVYQNVVFRGSIGDAVSLVGKAEDDARKGYAASGILGLFNGILTGAGVFAQGKLAPASKLVMHGITGRDDLGRPITLGGRAADVLPVPITGRSAYRLFFSDDADKYLWSERMLSMFGPLAQHVGESADDEDERRERRRRSAGAR